MSNDDATAQHVVRTLRALELLAEGPQTQAALSRELLVHRRTARRLLSRLVAEGYAEPAPDGRHQAYVASPRLAVLGRQVAEGLDLVAIGRRHLASIEGRDIGARFIAVLDGGRVVMRHLEEADSGRSPGEAAALEPGGPLYATAAGKVFLSDDDALLGEVLNHDLLAFTSKTLVGRADLLLELAAVRAQGYAVEDGEHRDDVRVVASGIVDHAGRNVAAMGVIAAGQGELDGLGQRIRDAAEAFSREIGAPGSDAGSEAAPPAGAPPGRTRSWV